jgi:hypothetical protein
MALKCTNESAVESGPFQSFFGLNDDIAINDGHTSTTNQLWTKFIPVGGSSTLYPKPDYVEGLDITKVPSWICDLLGGSIAPTTELAFPNFTVELEYDKPMRQGEYQNRHNGATCTQAYHKYYEEIVNDADHSWNTARVGSIQFNEREVEFNLHWVTKSIDGKPQYHMTSIFAHRTSKLLRLEDFKEVRKQARNFREYFQEIREKLLHELQLHLHPPVVLVQDQLPEGSQDFENPVQSFDDGHRVTQTEPLLDVDEQGGRGTSGDNHGGDKRKRQRETSGKTN